MGKQNFSRVQFSCNVIHVYVNANVVIPENIAVLDLAKITNFGF